MTLRAALYLFLGCLLVGCVTEGNIDPMKTGKGRDEARDAFIQLGIGYLQQGETGRAKVPLKKALELDPSSADAHVALALVFQREMEPELADAHFKKALSQNGSDARVLNNYGSFLFEQKRYEDALSKYAKAAEDSLYPERSRVFENMGVTSLQLGRVGDAKSYFERAYRLSPRQPRTLLELASLSYDAQDFVRAKKYYDDFRLGSEQNARSLLLGSRLARVFEDRDQAASLGLQLKRLYPGTPEYQQYLSEQ